MQTIEKVAYIYSRIREVNHEPQEQPGIDGDKVRDALRGLGLDTPPFIVDLFAWRNGIFHLNAFLHLLPLEEAIDIYRTYAALTSDYGDFGWKPSWFPLLDVNGDVQYCIDVADGKVATVDVEDGSSDKLEGNYDQYLDALVEAFQEELCQFSDVSRSFKIDRDSWAQLARKHGLTRSGL